MGYLKHLKRMDDNDARWIVKFDKNNKIKEVKLIFNPSDYATQKNTYPLLNRVEVIEILEKEKAGKEF